MSIENKVERILATYRPVEDKPGYVWFSEAQRTYIKLDVLREAYLEYLSKDSGHIIGGNVCDEEDNDFIE